LQAINSYCTTKGLTFVLQNNIDLSGIANFQPIGTDKKPFQGIFDGNGKEIQNLKINSTSSYVGLFGALQDAKVQNLSLTNVDITSTLDYVGGLAGQASNSTIEKVSVAGKLTGRNRIGGLIGGLVGGSVENTYTVGDIIGKSEVGGMVGFGNSLNGKKAIVKNIYSTAKVYGSSVNTTAILGNNAEGLGVTIISSFQIEQVVSINGTNFVNGWLENGVSVLSYPLNQATFTDAGWDFGGIWQWVDANNFPVLKK
jgi:hypothetical protein